MKGSVAKLSPPDGFGTRLRSLRKQKNLSQTELAELVGLHFTNISRYERGIAQPTVETLRRLAEILGVSSDYLMDGSVEQAAKARFEDRELLRQFKEVDQLSEEKKAFVKRVIDALLVKEKLRDLAG